MLYSKIIAVCSEIHIKHTNTLCGQNVNILSLSLVVYKFTTRPYRTKGLVKSKIHVNTIHEFNFCSENTSPLRLKNQSLNNPQKHTCCLL